MYLIARVVGTAVLAVLVVSGCKKVDPSARTAREFVEKNNAAGERRDYDVLWKMQAHDDGMGEQQWKEVTRRDFERSGRYDSMEYVSERQQAGAIVVTVTVAGAAGAEIVLVRQPDGQLRMLAEPSRWFEQHR